MDFRLHYPTTIAEAVAARRSTGGSYLCGGTVLLVDHYNGKRIAQDLVSLERIEELHRIDENDETISIGSACSFSQIEKHPAVKRYLGALYLSAREIGGPQIRNRGSIGGNYASASPASDMIAPILVLDPEIVMEDDLIVRFVFRKDEKVRSAFRKVGKRTALAVSSVSIAVSNRDGVYRVAEAGETGVDYIEAGSVTIKGLANTKYYLEEVEAPEGYTKLGARVELTADDTTELPVVNTTGTVLPSTGGIGTKLFMIFGSLMVVVFGTLLLTKFIVAKQN